MILYYWNFKLCRLCSWQPKCGIILTKTFQQVYQKRSMKAPWDHPHHWDEEGHHELAMSPHHTSLIDWNVSASWLLPLYILSQKKCQCTQWSVADKNNPLYYWYQLKWEHISPTILFFLTYWRHHHQLRIVWNVLKWLFSAQLIFRENIGNVK